MCLLLWFHNQLCGTFRTAINLATGACKAITAASVAEISLDGGSAIMAQNDLNQFIHRGTIVEAKSYIKLDLSAVAVLYNQCIMKFVVHLQNRFHFSFGVGS